MMHNRATLVRLSATVGQLLLLLVGIAGLFEQASWAQTTLKKSDAVAAIDPWQPQQPARAWKYIVYHHTATSQGSMQSINKIHRARLDADGKPWRGIAYHFLIGNGNGMPDGKIEPTFRWIDQIEGAHAGNKPYNLQGIGICLVGNFEQTKPTTAQLAAVRKLTEYLKSKYRIKPPELVGHRQISQTVCPGKFFPADLLTQAPRTTLISDRENSSQLGNEDAPLPPLRTAQKPGTTR